MALPADYVSPRQGLPTCQYEGRTLCEGEDLVVGSDNSMTFSWPVMASCQKGEIIVDNTYAGIIFNKKRGQSFVISQGKPLIYQLLSDGSGLVDVTSNNLN